MVFAEVGTQEWSDNELAPNQFMQQAAHIHKPLTSWLTEGLRAGFFISPKLIGAEPKPWQVLLLVSLHSAIGLAMGRLQVSGPAIFETQAWLSSWWTVLLFIALAWWLWPKSHQNLAHLADFSEQTEPKESVRNVSIASACLVWLLAQLPAGLTYDVYNLAQIHEVIKLPSTWMAWAYWVAYIGYLLWVIGVTIFVAFHFYGRHSKTVVFVVCLIAGMALTVTQFNARTWQEDYSQRSTDEVEKPRLQLSQQVFEEQEALLKQKMASVAAQRKDRNEVYGLVFAPYASEDVFLRESTMVSNVLRDRFDTGDRIIHLLNHGGTTKTHPWATTRNLEQAVITLAGKMDLEKDVLVVYMTSHGGSDFKLAASHWPLEVAPLTPQELKNILDKAGVRNRVIAISACYAGGWADVLATDYSLIMTAADATHTSYGCGSRSELTFFGRALFDEQLRKTHSFEQAFNLAVPIIKQREIDADKKDGFSNPQIRIGTQIRPLLKKLELRLNALQPEVLPLSVKK
jgi:hypothetical protein